ncbi:MAG: hypothetical protein B6D46_14665 [Polyangiaceae bacterium UTPRO1]|jgi:hypothetical protein|nr:hypothetical protein [Myxococcales bacterium]OQY65080.1 MAG: hypothetical protein B6D46_14665 [Polyangiaceae bacterium UTPRO1]
MPSFRSLLPVVVLAAAFALGFRVMHRPQAAVAPAPVAMAAPDPTPLEAAAAPSPSPSVVRRTVRTETEIAPAGMVPEVGTLAGATADDYERRARFPRSSQPIDDGIDPIVRDREVTPGKSVGPEGTRPTLVVWPEKTSFEAPGPIVVHAYLVNQDRKVDPRALHGEIRTQQGGTLAALDFRDDGSGGDATANDLVYTAVVAPGRERALEFKGAQLVEVRAETKNGEERSATSGFLYSVPLAHLTGRFRDAFADGSLVIEAEVQVDAAARFHLEATLGGPDGTPLSWAQNAQELEPGTAWIPLTYWGLILREHGVDGPYRLLSVALSTTGEMPNQKNDVLSGAYVTGPYRANAFSDRPYNDPGLLDAAARLRAEAPAVGGLEAGTAR